MASANQMAIATVERPLSASVVIPGSKSISNRVLLLSALADGVSTLTNVQISDDTLVFVRALQALGFGVEDTGGATCVVTGAAGGPPNDSASVWCGSAGTAARFLLASVAAGHGQYHFDATAQMKRRPMHTLIAALQAQGVGIETSTGTFPLDMATRGLSGGPAQMDARESSQFTSAFLMAAPLCHAPLELEADVRVSRPYIDMTTRLMEQFGVAVERPRHDLFLVGNGRAYQAHDCAIEPDASTASYFAAAAAVVGGRVTVEHLPLEGSLQGDTQFLRVLEEMGCRLTQEGGSTTVEGTGGPAGRDRGHGRLLGHDDDAGVRGAVRGLAHHHHQHRARPGQGVGPGAQRRGGAGVDGGAGDGDGEHDHGLPAKPRGATIDTFGDHRIAMAFSVMGLVTPGVVIDDYTCVDKTCPEFFDLLADMVAQG